MIDRFTITANTAGAELHVESLTITRAEDWSPYLQGTLVLALPSPLVVAALDPRKPTPPKVEVRIIRDFGDDRNKLERWTAAALVAGVVRMSKLTALGAGAASFGTQFATHYNGAPVSGQELRLVLPVDKAETDEAAGTLTLEVGGVEIRLQDQTGWETQPLLGPRIRDTVNDVLHQCGFGLLGAGEGMALAATPVWKERASAWATLAEWLDTAELRLIFDEAGSWRIISRESTRPASPVTLAGLTQLSRRLDRADWYDGVIIWWKWEELDPGTGKMVERVEREVVQGFINEPPPTFTKVLHVDMPGPRKGTYTGNALYRKWRRKGDKHRYIAPADLNVRPLDRIQVTDSAGTRTATITRVTLAFPAATITVDTRED